MNKIVGVIIKDSSGKFFKEESPKRHADLVIQMGIYYENLPMNQIPKIVFQGFYTDTGEVLSREDAYILARQNGQAQVKRPSERLYSEDLW